jgi:hypothetical protein
LTPFSNDAFFAIAAGIATTGSQSLSQEMSLSPNPTNGALNAMATATANANEEIIITDLHGRTVMEENTNVIKGVNNINLDSLGTGTYILILRDGNNQMTSMRFIKE